MGECFRRCGSLWIAVDSWTPRISIAISIAQVPPCDLCGWTAAAIPSTYEVHQATTGGVNLESWPPRLDPLAATNLTNHKGLRGHSEHLKLRKSLTYYLIWFRVWVHVLPQEPELEAPFGQDSPTFLDSHSRICFTMFRQRHIPSDTASFLLDCARRSHADRSCSRNGSLGVAALTIWYTEPEEFDWRHGPNRWWTRKTANIIIHNRCIYCIYIYYIILYYIILYYITLHYIILHYIILYYIILYYVYIYIHLLIQINHV